MKLLDNLLQHIPEVPFLKKTEVQTEPYFSLNITLSEVTASVWSVDAHKVEIQDQTTLAYSSLEDLLQKANQALDQALGPSLIEPHKILFGVPNSWSEEDNLKSENLGLLKRMVAEFDLAPLAFVTTSHALTHFLHKSQGIVPTGILLGFGDYLEVSLVQTGKIISSRVIKRTDHNFEDIEKVLLQFEEVEVLPSKLFLYPTKGGLDLERLKDELTGYPWMNKLSFLHFPKIEVLKRDDFEKAIILAGATEVDPDVSLKHSFMNQISTPLATKSTGFRVGDVMSESESKTAWQEPLEHLEESALMAPEVVERNLESVARGAGGVLERVIPGKIYSKLAPYLRLPFRSFGGGDKRRRYLVLVGLVILLIGYLLLFKAEVTLFVDSQVLEKQAMVTADPSVKTIDEANNIIPGKVVEDSLSGSGKGVATGQKQIGNSARGKVIIYNLTNNQISYSSGAILTADNGLRFTLDTSVNVASQSSSTAADFTTVIKPGKSNPVGVTAVNIGPDSNLSAGAELAVGTSAKSSVVARVDEALSGGTSQTVTVVTSDDQKKLQASIIDSLRQKAKDQIQGKLTQGQKIIPEALAVSNSAVKFSKGVNDQASEFSANVDVNFKGVSYQDSDLKQVVSKLVVVDVPEGYTLSLDDSETEASVAKVDKDKLTFSAKFKAKLLPKFEQSSIQNLVRFKTISMAISSLKGLSNVVDAQVKLSPGIPSLGILPVPLLNIAVHEEPK